MKGDHRETRNFDPRSVDCDVDSRRRSARSGRPTGLGSMISHQKHEKTHRTNWIQVVRHKVMGMVAVAEGGIAEAGARKAKMKAAMAAKAKQGVASKPQI
jgi:hypothetical protein